MRLGRLPNCSDVQGADNERAAIRVCFYELSFGRDVILQRLMIDDEDERLVRQQARHSLEQMH
jgi:hypothetical protein